ncbi:MAG TPA: DMT family transporter [Rhodanobacteraceae bacterium]|nr:DMT family transporter [Rhodanobacteraceae bacterium]
MSANQNLRGMLSMLLAVATFSLMDAALKTLTPNYPPMQVAALRGLSSLPLVTLWVIIDGGPGQLLRVRWPLHILRGLVSIVMIAAFAYALRTLPLAETYSLFFVAPLMITALAALVLGERVDWRGWTAIVIGFCGTLIVLRPTGAGVLTLAGLAVLVSATGYSISAIAVRVLGRSDSTQAMVFWMLLMMSVFATALAWHDWVPIRAEDWSVIAALAVTGAVGQFAITDAFRRAAASRIAPLEYTALIWGIILDRLLWNTLPDAITLTGAGVIIASGIYLLRREREHSEAEHP